MKIGIDPGNTGALALMTDDGVLVEVVDMPIMAMGKKNQVNATEVANIVRDWKTMIEMDGLKLAAYLEKVGAMPRKKDGSEIKMGSSSMFNFGKGVGNIEGVLAALKIPMFLVTPQAWKKHHKLAGTEKDMARTLAIQQYPHVSESLARKKDIGRADAILIASFGCADKVLVLAGQQ